MEQRFDLINMRILEWEDKYEKVPLGYKKHEWIQRCSGKIGELERERIRLAELMGNSEFASSKIEYSIEFDMKLIDSMEEKIIETREHYYKDETREKIRLKLDSLIRKYDEISKRCYTNVNRMSSHTQK